jgi:hypothetical protein
MAKESIRILPAETGRASAEVRDGIEISSKTKGSRDMRRLAYLGLLVVSIAAWIGIIWLFVAWFH